MNLGLQRYGKFWIAWNNKIQMALNATLVYILKWSFQKYESTNLITSNVYVTVATSNTTRNSQYFIIDKRHSSDISIQHHGSLQGVGMRLLALTTPKFIVWMYKYMKVKWTVTLLVMLFSSIAHQMFGSTSQLQKASSNQWGLMDDSPYGTGANTMSKLLCRPHYSTMNRSNL